MAAAAATGTGAVLFVVGFLLREEKGVRKGVVIILLREKKGECVSLLLLLLLLAHSTPLHSTSLPAGGRRTERKYRRWKNPVRRGRAGPFWPVLLYTKRRAGKKTRFG